VGGYFSVARHLLGRGELQNYVATALYVVDFATQRFPRRAL
jgi:hypothetical protein